MKRLTLLLVSSALFATSVMSELVIAQRQVRQERSREGKPAQFRRAAQNQPSVSRRPADLGTIPAPSRLQSPEPQYVPNQVLIQLSPTAGHDVKVSAASMVQALRIEEVENIRPTRQGQGELLLASLPQGITVESAIAQVKDLPGIKFAQKNWIYTIQQSLSDDAEYTNGALWGMYSDDLPSDVGPAGTTNQYGCQAEKAWTTGHIGSRDVYVGIIDEGVQSEHPDLAPNIWTNPGESGLDESGRDRASNGRDDDGNGRIDDVHGWDFFNQDNTVYDGGPSGNADRHGTHVAGTIGAKGGNALGVAGVNWNVTMIAAKFIGPTGGTTDKAVEAIDYFVKLKRERGLNLVAINASWGGGGYDLALLEAIKRAARENILFVAAAGNGDFLGRPINTDAKVFYPACYDTTMDTVREGGTPGVAYDSVISVAAIKSDGTVARFSNFGVKTVDLGAPGDGIASTWPSSIYQLDSGTSMAAPHVTGAIALYASTHSRATAAMIKTAILDSAKATPTTALNDKTGTGGRLNVSSF